MISTVMFDLDGTLLPMDQEVFAKAYIGGLGKTAAQIGYDAKEMMGTIIAGTAAMVQNTGEKTNEAVFWDVLAKTYGEKIFAEYHMFDEFYQTDFQKVKDVCGYDARAKEVIASVKQMGYRTVLATNPLFPSVATESRIRWAGLAPTDFEYVTTYENSCHCKPNLDYYREILEKLKLAPEECLMVGNDVGEDMIASQLGMKTFLLTDCMINRKNEDVSVYPNGGFAELLNYLHSVN